MLSGTLDVPTALAQVETLFDNTLKGNVLIPPGLGSYGDTL